MKTIQISDGDYRTLKLCIAGAWLYESISRGRAHELARAIGATAQEIDNLKFVEDRNREEEAATSPQPHPPEPQR